MQPVILFLAVFLPTYVDAIIPLPCANMHSLTNRTCCPTPNATLFPGAGQCGVNLGRGSCAPVTNPEYKSSETDVRKNWPVQYFMSVCKCNESFGGFDCGECSFAYNDGTTTCTTKTVRPRVSVSSMNGDEWKTYLNALGTIKTDASRYMVATNRPSGASRADKVKSVVDSLVQPTTYDLFVWLHHLVAKDNDVTKCKYFCHIGGT